VFDGSTPDAIAHYRAMQTAHTDAAAAYRAPPASKGNHLVSARVRTSEAGGVHRAGQPIAFDFEIDVPEPATTLCFSFQVIDADERSVCHLWCFDRDTRFRRDAGRYRLAFEVPVFRAYKGSYTLRTFLSDRRTYTEFENLSQLCQFAVTMDGIERQEYEWEDGTGAYLEDHSWTLARVEPAEPGESPQRGGFHA
jgi:lipopolysaccharide transport system ATP-binding protein